MLVMSEDANCEGQRPTSLTAGWAVCGCGSLLLLGGGIMDGGSKVVAS